MKIHYPGQQGGPFGWGQFGANMVRCWQEMGVWAENWMEADCIFHPIADHDFNTPFPQTPRAKVNFAMTFFESALGPNAAANAAKYDVLFVGSTWCKERCSERGIHNTEVLIQGVDRSIFKPLPYSFNTPSSVTMGMFNDGEGNWHQTYKPQFRIFSGGKFEYRKGQDLVIAAFREFAKDHPEAHLVCSWWNPWPQLISGMAQSNCINWDDIACKYHDQQQVFRHLLVINDIEESQFTILPQLTHAELAREMANTDCGLFPNRCEGGTNLVLMEYAACGGIVAANGATGHADVDHLIDAYIPCELDERGWARSQPKDVADVLSYVHQVHTLCSGRRKGGIASVPTWESAAKQVVTRAEELLATHSHK